MNVNMSVMHAAMFTPNRATPWIGVIRSADNKLCIIIYFLLGCYWAHLKLILSNNSMQFVLIATTGGSPSIHTITALITALVLTGVAMLFYWSWQSSSQLRILKPCKNIELELVRSSHHWAKYICGCIREAAALERWLQYANHRGCGL